MITIYGDLNDGFVQFNGAHGHVSRFTIDTDHQPGGFQRHSITLEIAMTSLPEINPSGRIPGPEAARRNTLAK